MYLRQVGVTLLLVEKFSKFKEKYSKGEKMANTRLNTAYGLSQAIINEIPYPVISTRNPTANDKAQIGQVWVNKANNTSFVLTSVVNNVSVWGSYASVAGNITAAGTMTAGTGLVATTGGVTAVAGGLTVTAGGLTVSAGGAVITGNSAVIGTLSSTSAMTAATTLVVGTGLAVSAGGAAITGLTAVTGAITATTTITAGTNLVATAGSITATAGDVIVTGSNTALGAAAKSLQLGAGGPKILSSVGIPTVVAPEGSICTRSDGAANARIYVATDNAGTWIAVPLGE